jgi:hypothetical protein
LISESLVGFNVAATRQNAGRSAAGAAFPRPAGRLNPPAAIACAIVTDVFGSTIDERLSQEPVTGAALRHVTGSNRANTRIFMNHLLGIFKIYITWRWKASLSLFRKLGNALG